MPKRPKTYAKEPKHPADFFHFVERLIGSAEGHERVELPAFWVRWLLALARRAPKRRGRPPLTGRQVIDEKMVVGGIRRRKAQLRAGGMKAAAAEAQAAQEASTKLRRVSGRNLAPPTLSRRTRRHPRR
jgi:hypothetical protein